MLIFNHLSYLLQGIRYHRNALPIDKQITVTVSAEKGHDIRRMGEEFDPEQFEVKLPILAQLDNEQSDKRMFGLLLLMNIS